MSKNAGVYVFARRRDDGYVLLAHRRSRTTKHPLKLATLGGRERAQKKRRAEQDLESKSRVLGLLQLIKVHPKAKALGPGPWARPPGPGPGPGPPKARAPGYICARPHPCGYLQKKQEFS